MDALARLDDRLARRSDAAPAVLRVGLGLVILGAGVHKLVDPGAWAVYSAPWVEALWPVDMRTTMLLAGVTEVPFGLLLLADRYATAAAAVVAASMVGTVAYLAALALTTGNFVDVLVRDVGILALAAGVTLLSAARD